MFIHRNPDDYLSVSVRAPGNSGRLDDEILKNTEDIERQLEELKKWLDSLEEQM